MRILTPSVDLHHFLARIASANERVLILDYDGTLAPFRVRPELATPYPGVRKALAQLMENGETRVVIVSGRRVEELVPLLALERHPEIWGCHGWERLSPDGDLQSPRLPENEKAALAEAAGAALSLARGGARIEHKPASIALHWRGLPALTIAAVREEAHALWRPLAERAAVDLLAFDGGLEVRAKGCNKQHAVKVVLSETAGTGAIAYLGDDLTDEDAFQVVKLRGLAVLVRPEFRETAADVWIRPPQELVAFLERWRDASRGP